MLNKILCQLGNTHDTAVVDVKRNQEEIDGKCKEEWPADDIDEASILVNQNHDCSAFQWIRISHRNGCDNANRLLWYCLFLVEPEAAGDNLDTWHICTLANLWYVWRNSWFYSGSECTSSFPEFSCKSDERTFWNTTAPESKLKVRRKPCFL